MKFAVIFDMNGVIIDDMSYHKKAWRIFCHNMGKDFTDKEFRNLLSGRHNREILSYVLERELTEYEILGFEEAKENIYREQFKNHRKLLPGLLKFLIELRSNEIPMAVATSAPPVNIDYILEYLEIKNMFSAIVDASQVKKGKPDPEIFIKAADYLNIDPKQCIVFEDSLLGIEAAKRANMKVIAIATTHPSEELTMADLGKTDFESVDINLINRIFNK